MTTEQTGHGTAGRRAAETDAPQGTSSSGNNVVLSAVLVILLFGLFCAGLYVMALFTTVTFLAGLAMVLLSLYLTFDTVPRLLT